MSIRLIVGEKREEEECSARLWLLIDVWEKIVRRANSCSDWSDLSDSSQRKTGHSSRHTIMPASLLAKKDTAASALVVTTLGTMIATI